MKKQKTKSTGTRDYTVTCTTQALKVILPKRYEIFDEPPKKGKDYNDYLCIQLGIWKSKERNFER